MNPYIGDRQLEPDEDHECETCGGCGIIQDWVDNNGNWDAVSCPDCHHDSDPGEPQPCPDKDQ